MTVVQKSDFVQVVFPQASCRHIHYLANKLEKERRKEKARISSL